MQAFPWSGLAVRAALLGLVVLELAACSGAVSSGPAASSGPIVVSPATAVLYSELPTTFTITGGNGNYIVTSSDQNVLPVAGTTTNNAFVVVPNDVGADTPVTLTVRDTSNSAQATAALTIKPRTISNVVTITPSSGQSAACGTALCAGGDAEVKVTLAQLGVPLAGRTVQFDVLSGDLRIIGSTSGGTEILTSSATAITDSSGTARIRVRADGAAGAQTALLNITDRSSGFVQSAAISIAPSTSATLTVQPATINFTGTSTTTCANNVSADVIVVGGRPPYQVTKPAGFNVNPTTLTTSGGRITVTATGQCARTGSTSSGTTIPDAGQVLGIVDSNGATASVTIHNDPAPVTTAPSPLNASPSAVTLGCGQAAFISIVGGNPPYYASSGNGNVLKAEVSYGANGSYVGILTRQSGVAPSNGSSTSPFPTVDVAFSDGQSVKVVTATLNPAACP